MLLKKRSWLYHCFTKWFSRIKYKSNLYLLIGVAFIYFLCDSNSDRNFLHGWNQLSKLFLFIKKSYSYYHSKRTLWADMLHFFSINFTWVSISFTWSYFHILLLVDRLFFKVPLSSLWRLFMHMALHLRRNGSVYFVHFPFS